MSFASPGIPPALFTSTSIFPNRSSAAATIASTEARSVTSVRTQIASPPSRFASATARPPASSSRCAATTFAPSVAKRRAAVAPIPLVGQLPLYYEQFRFSLGLQYGS